MSSGRRWEALAERIHEVLVGERAKLVVVYAPTGFGKTMASPHLLHLARKSGMASRLIHVVPTRALLKQIFNEKFREAGEKYGVKVTYQSHDRMPGALKSPYFLSDLVVTTLDSFLLNAYKLQPSELSKVLEGVSEGHYYPVVSSLASSVVVFDEAHLYVGDWGDPNTAKLVASAIAALTKMEVPCIIETATLPSLLLDDLVRKTSLRESTKAIYVCEDTHKCNQVEEIEKKNVRVEILKDKSYVPLKWNTRFTRREEVSQYIREHCGNRLILYVANSVERAAEAYRELRESCEAILIHSRLTEADREKAEEAIKKLRGKGRGLIVGSPVIEVGVDIDAEVLVTEPAPIENLAQRAGRLCRARTCEEGAQVIIIDDESLSGPYGKKPVTSTLRLLRGSAKDGIAVEWRALWDTNSGVTYVELLEAQAKENQDLYSIEVSNVLEDIVNKDTRPLAYINEILNKFKGLSLFKIAVKHSTPEDLNRHYILVDIDLLRRLDKMGCLERENDTVKIALLASSDGNYKIILYDSRMIPQMLKSYSITMGLIKGLKREFQAQAQGYGHIYDYFVVAKRECYEEGVGLGVRSMA